ncbi:hypothetical protein L1987_24680 [Smallanthus sonchifolius]|uniref:Uncharacterized protein n=1 Tax=Smallanthus sonchifolius TaxID=185202 RepID=A0ACB9IMJ3_9ASTR|nr:hypothetical protein L1987_24680 [Smallanthus sonchifolius]
MKFLLIVVVVHGRARVTANVQLLPMRLLLSDQLLIKIRVEAINEILLIIAQYSILVIKEWNRSRKLQEKGTLAEDQIEAQNNVQSSVKKRKQIIIEMASLEKNNNAFKRLRSIGLI